MKCSCFAGLCALGVLIFSLLGTLIVVYPNYNFWKETFSQIAVHETFSTVLLSTGLILSGFFGIPFFIELSCFFKSSQISLAAGCIACLSCIMLIMTGFFLPTDKPINHGIFAYGFFLSMALAVGLYSSLLSTKPRYERILQQSGYILCPFIFLIAITTPSSLIPFVQKLVIIIYIIWLPSLGVLVCQGEYADYAE